MYKTILILLFLSPLFLYAQGPLERSVQVSAEVQNDPPAIHFTWAWDWSGPSYSIHRRLPNESDWGEPVVTLPWQATEWTDTDIESGVAYEYAFFKRQWETLRDTFCVEANVPLRFKIGNIYGNGICCNFGIGQYDLNSCGETIAMGSDFGLEDITEFTPCDDGSGCSEVYLNIFPDMQTQNHYWVLQNVETGDTLAARGLPLAERTKFGFILAGMEVPAIEERGEILLLVEERLADALPEELTQLRRDLIGDGWRVYAETIEPTDDVVAVKSLIQKRALEYENLQMLYLFGHLPVPYSGSFYADGHSENHWGAWPADVYYGDLDGVWTDSEVTNLNAFFPRNHNLPGDGKFDQSSLPSPVELQVGRVDLSGMPAFGDDEIELYRQYLHKAHLWKTAQRNAERRAVMDDNLGSVLGSPAASGWRNFPQLFGQEKVDEVDYFTTMQQESYIWSYGGGSGTHVSANGIGSTTDFANAQLQNIFTMLLGSQFGDWDNVNNFLRAPLASESWTLTSCWAGNPPWTLHHTALGYPMGYAALRTQNASINDYRPGPQLVHTALMGDPSLRLHPVRPVRTLTAAQEGNTILLNWDSPEESDLRGFYVYRSTGWNERFERIGSVDASTFSYVDVPQDSGQYVYMIRTVKLETSGSGTYHNLSLGEFVELNFVPSVIDPVSETEEHLRVYVYPNPVYDELRIVSDLTWKSLGLYNAKGECVRTWSGTTAGLTRLSVADLPMGLYEMELRDLRGHLYRQRVVLVR